MQNYTGYGWEGKNYQNNLSTTDIAKIMARQQLKKDFPQCKFSVTSKSFSGGSEISCHLMVAPFEVFTDEIDEHSKRDQYDQVNHYNLEDSVFYTKKALVILKKVTSMFTSYRYDDSDGQIDYFSTNFYFSLNIGKWDKPFVITKTKVLSL